MAASSEQLKRLASLFKACDEDDSGYIDEAELERMCPDLSKDDIHSVFSALDKNGDGQISPSEFSQGFNDIGKLMARRASLVRRQSTEKEGEADLQGEFIHSLDQGFTALSCQEQVCDLYQQLHTAELPNTLADFEEVIVCILKDVRVQQYEKERLETSYKREKEKHAAHLQQLEEEMDAQMQRVEERVKSEEKEKSELERKELQAKFDLEVADLHINLRKLQKLEKDASAKNLSDELKLRLVEVTLENRQLKGSLTETQTNLALIRSDMATTKQDFKDKCEELETERESMVDYIKEQENLTRQLHLLHDANRKLHDTNDDLREAVEASRPHKRSYIGSTAPRVMNLKHHPSLGNIAVPGSMVSGYAGTALNSGYPSLADELQNTELIQDHSQVYNRSISSSVASSQRPILALNRSISTNTENYDIDSLPEDIDSGHFTLRDGRDIDSEMEPTSFDEDFQQMAPRKRHRRLKTPRIQTHQVESSYSSQNSQHSDDHQMESEVTESQDDMNTAHFMETDQLEVEGEGDEIITDHSISRPCSVCSHTSSHSSRHSQHRRTTTKKQELPPLQRKITGEPERMYKVVLAGDAAVGKSSFIMRLCKDKFVSNLSSTLGVDFQTKVIEVDGRVIALQLWDTAGQERFRSIAKSYFRRADGVLLLYDCCWERSFLSVRDWVEAVEMSSTKKLPIMLCGNKSDLRDVAKGENRKVVPFEDGLHLAREFEALFIETSAKEGENVMEAVTELARLLRTNEDIEVQSVGMQLQDMKNNKKSTCC